MKKGLLNTKEDVILIFLGELTIGQIVQGRIDTSGRIDIIFKNFPQRPKLTKTKKDKDQKTKTKGDSAFYCCLKALLRIWPSLVL